MAQFTIKEIHDADNSVHGDLPVHHEVVVHFPGGFSNHSGKIRLVGDCYWVGSLCMESDTIVDDMDDLDSNNNNIWRLFCSHQKPQGWPVQ